MDLEHTKLENIPNKIKFALENGYRLIDTAKIYKNEEEVGKGINEYLSSHKEIKREDLYIVTKLWQDEHNDPVNALKNSLKRLNLSYVDLFLIHWPLPNYSNNKVEKKVPLHKIWEGMEKCVELGLTKSIGVSNFNAGESICDNLEKDYLFDLLHTQFKDLKDLYIFINILIREEKSSDEEIEKMKIYQKPIKF